MQQQQRRVWCRSPRTPRDHQHALRAARNDHWWCAARRVCFIILFRGFASSRPFQFCVVFFVYAVPRMQKSSTIASRKTRFRNVPTFSELGVLWLARGDALLWYDEMMLWWHKTSLEDRKVFGAEIWAFVLVCQRTNNAAVFGASVSVRIVVVIDNLSASIRPWKWWIISNARNWNPR